MSDELEGFSLKITDFSSRPPSELIPYFVYFLTVVQGEFAATGAGVTRCFELMRVPPYSNVAAYLSRLAKRGKSQKFLKVKGGYQLTLATQLELQKTLHTGPAKLETSLLLRGLLTKVSSQAEKTFLMEAIDCYEIGARRAAIVMTWLLALNHLYEHILAKELAVFNAALAKDKGVKINAVSKLDDFGEMKETKFIELARAAGILSNDVRKILDVKLGIRNSAAHPSAVTVSEVKATEFIIDLVENVVLKY